MKRESIVILVLFITLGVVLNFLPHLNYDYPMHADEWTHMAYAKNLTSSTWYFEKAHGKDLEIGFHVILAVLNKLGFSYLFIFRFFPALMTILISLGVFLWVRKISNEKAALFSVLFIALLSSSVTILGMVYFLPLSFGLLFIPAGLYLFEIRSKWFFLLFTALLYIHPPSSLAFFLLISISILYKKERLIENFALLVFGGMLALPLYIDIFIRKGLETTKMLSYELWHMTIFMPGFLGYMVFALVVLGIIFAIKKEKYLLILYSLAFFILMLLYWFFRIEIYVYYWRILMYFFIISSAFFGIACQEIIDFAQVFGNKKIRVFIVISLLLVILIPAVPHKIKTGDKLYKIIDNNDYRAFLWIRGNTDENSVAILNNFKGYAFTPIAERRVYTKLMPGISKKYDAMNKEVDIFLNESCMNLSFLKANNISLVYGNCSNEKLKEIYPELFVFDW